MQDPWKVQADALGAYIRAQRKPAQLSLRELAAATELSDAYLSQVERGLHQPSVPRSARSRAASTSPRHALSEAGLLDEHEEGTSGPASVEPAVRADPALTATQKEALLSVCRSFMAERDGGGEPTQPGSE